MTRDSYQKKLKTADGEVTYYDITKLEKDGIADIHKLPFSIRILVENLLRKLDGRVVREEDFRQIAQWQKRYESPVEIPYHPSRVLMQDFTGVPAVVDLAAMRDAVRDLGGDPEVINPLVPVELITDHSVQLDYFGTTDAIRGNVEMEYHRNGERYKLLKWAQKSFTNMKVVPPNSGICHQVNLEYLGRVVIVDKGPEGPIAYPDSLVGTDSHTTMINGLGVMGWGVGGIEAEAVMLGQPYYMTIPEVIGVRLTGALRPGVTATDMVLTITEMLREYNVVEKFVEFFGEGMKHLRLPDRATIANMSPEYGATMGFFPVDENTIEYLRASNRVELAETVECYTRENGLFYTGVGDPEYTDVRELDLSTVEPCIAGPARPQDRIELTDVKEKVGALVDTSAAEENGPYRGEMNGKEFLIDNGSVVIAAITSCTNTSNPDVLIGAGLIARNAVKRGLRVPAHVKTSLAPGSKVVTEYLRDAGLTPYLDALGFHTAAFGCTTCIGNSGPLHPAIEDLVVANDLTVASVLSGNRNFEARIHQKIKANFLASPMLVVLFALTGKVNVDLTREPVGLDPNGSPVFMQDLWPSEDEIGDLVKRHVKSAFYADGYAKIFDGDEFWKGLSVAESTTFSWDSLSTYIKKPPYFDDFSLDLKTPEKIRAARPLLLLGDTVTTDHISPAGAIAEEYPAGQYLIEKGVSKTDFNSYGSRRGNHEVMMRGTFGNIRIRNQLISPKEGSFTVKMPETEEMFIYDAAMEYSRDGVPLVVLSGKEYGTGSSRDWAAKGTNLLGVRAVIARSYERIHRSNLVGMGVLPLVFMDSDSTESLGLDGTELFTVKGMTDISPRKVLEITAEKEDGSMVSFKVQVRLDTVVDVEYFNNGGILPCVLRKLMKEQAA